MPATQTTRGDPPGDPDPRDTIQIDRTGPERYRYTCPNGHPQWDRTNNHIWCPGCQRQAEQGADISPEHWELLDKKTDETIPWNRVEIVAE